MEVGVNSYVTIDEADTYIETHYRKNNAGRLRWSVLDEEDKIILLINACEEIELLQYVGRKVKLGQVLAFPRLPAQYYSVGDPLKKIKAAQIELALWLSDDAKQEEYRQRMELIEQGVKSFSLGKLSESYEKAGQDNNIVLSCPKARSILAPFMNGGFSTC